MKKVSIVLALLFFTGLKTQAQQKIQETPKQAEESPKKKEEAKTKETKYALAIFFISKGTGIDHATFGKIEEAIKNHPKKPAFNTVQKGREGEKSIYLKLAELSKTEKKALIEEIEKIAAGKELVKVQKDFTVKTAKAK